MAKPPKNEKPHLPEQAKAALEWLNEQAERRKERQTQAEERGAADRDEVAVVIGRAEERVAEDIALRQAMHETSEARRDHRAAQLRHCQAVFGRRIKMQ